MPGEARSPLTPDPDTTPREGVALASSPDDPTDGAARRPAPARRRRLFVLLAGIAVLAYATDQVSKVVALDRLADGQPRPFVGDLLQLRLIFNPGAALSLGAGNTWVMTAIALGVLVAIGFVAKGLGSTAWAVALGLLLGAALGNLTDRFVRPPGGGQGHVVDFIDYNGWFIGNVADIWIVGAAGLIVLLALLGIGVDGRRDRDVRAARATGEPDQQADQQPDQQADPQTDPQTDRPTDRSREDHRA